MNVAGAIRRATRIAKAVTTTVRADVTLEAWTGQGGTGTPTYADAVTLSALVFEGPRPFRTALGETVTVKALLYILEPVTANGTTGRREPIDPRDKITLPSGIVGAPIEGVPGDGNAVDPETGASYFHAVGLG